MMSILYLGNKLSDRGKTETTIEILSKNLRLEGFSVFTFSDQKIRLLRLLNMLYSILKFANKVDYVLIDTYSTLNFYYAYFVSQLCRIINLKYIPILHGGNLPNRLKSSPKLSRAIFKNAYKNIAPSNYIKTEFENFNYDNIICIPNAITLQNYHFNERKYETVKLLWVRSFSKIYNPLLAIKILRSLIDDNIQAELCMVGPDIDGSLIEAKRYAKQLNVDVRFTGKMLKQEWIALSEEYNIFINTTNFDNMPVSVIEAMALGLPVISTNVGGIPYLIDNNKNGVLVEPNSPEAFVNAIKDLINSPEKTIDLTKNARNSAERFDWNNIKSQWIKVFQ
ncbi:MAG: glycosyltransferase family 4 protein [Flaviramulus sp.]|nr:glycosyltransferase family 4 protein [Flaviramulus sp.]NNC50920.1 glycosyltransferase family 4 protein [Flaviramulus sp.]